MISHPPPFPRYPSVYPGRTEPNPVKLTITFSPSNTDSDAGLKKEITVDKLQPLASFPVDQREWLLVNHLQHVLFQYIAETDYIIHGSTAVSLNLPDSVSPGKFCNDCQKANSKLILATDKIIKRARSAFPPDTGQCHDIDLFINHPHPNTKETIQCLKASLEEHQDLPLELIETTPKQINKVCKGDTRSTSDKMLTIGLLKSIIIKYNGKQILKIDITYPPEEKNDEPYSFSHPYIGVTTEKIIYFAKGSIKVRVCTIESSIENYLNAFVANSSQYKSLENKFWNNIAALDDLIKIQQLPLDKPNLMGDCIDRIKEHYSFDSTYVRTKLPGKQDSPGPFLENAIVPVSTPEPQSCESQSCFSLKKPKAAKPSQNLPEEMFPEATDGKKNSEMLLEKNLAERNQQLEKTNKVLAERTGQLEKTRKMLADKHKQLPIKDKKLKESNRQLTRMGQMVAEKDKQMEQKNIKIAELNSRLQAFESKACLESGVQTDPVYATPSDGSTSAIEQDDSDLSNHSSSEYWNKDDSIYTPSVIMEQDIEDGSIDALKKTFDQNMHNLILILKNKKKQRKPLNFYINAIRSLKVIFDKLTESKKDWLNDATISYLMETEATIIRLSEYILHINEWDEFLCTSLMIYASPLLNLLHYKFSKSYYEMKHFEQIHSLQHTYITKLGKNMLSTKERLDQSGIKGLPHEHKHFLATTIEQNYACIVDIVQPDATDSGLLMLAKSENPDTILHMIYILNKISKEPHPEMLLMQLSIYRASSLSLKKDIMSNWCPASATLIDALKDLKGSAVVYKQLTSLYSWFYETHDFILSATLLTKHLELIYRDPEYLFSAFKLGFCSDDNQKRISQIYQAITCTPVNHSVTGFTKEVSQLRTRCQQKLKEAMTLCHNFLVKHKELTLPQLDIKDLTLDSRLAYWQDCETQEKQAVLCTVI